MSTIAYVYRDETHINVAAPYDRDFVAAARRHGGQWNASRKLWQFSRRECNLSGIETVCQAFYTTVQNSTPPAKQAPPAPQSAGHVGKVGETIEVAATITRAMDLEPGRFGPARLYVLHTAGGHMLVWRSTSMIEDAAMRVGEYVVLKGTVKQHDLYRGAPQTVLTRCKVLGRSPNGAPAQLAGLASTVATPPSTPIEWFELPWPCGHKDPIYVNANVQRCALCGAERGPGVVETPEPCDDPSLAEECGF